MLPTSLPTLLLTAILFLVLLPRPADGLEWSLRKGSLDWILPVEAYKSPCDDACPCGCARGLPCTCDNKAGKIDPVIRAVLLNPVNNPQPAIRPVLQPVYRAVPTYAPAPVFVTPGAVRPVCGPGG